MTDEPDPISPCVAVCVMNQDTGQCYGCYRTIDEIGGWMMMSRDQRRDVLTRVAARREADPSRKRK